MSDEVMPNFWNVADGVLLFGRYRVERTLDQTADRAFFVLEPDQPGERGALVEAVRAGAPGAAEQSRSWELGSRLSHPNLIRILETGRDPLEDEEVLYAVMEFPEEHLSDVLNERALTPGEAREVAASLANALQYLHRSGVVHGNLRPAQVAAVGERIKIPVDQARLSGSPAPEPFPGAPPEWAAGGEALPAGDMWSLGVLLHEILTRQPPVFDRAGRPRLEGVDAQLAEVIRGCLRQDPEKRWTAVDVKRYLEGGGAPREEPAPVPVPVRTPSAAAEPGSRGSRHWVLLGVALVIVLVVMWLVRQPKTPPAASTPPAQTAAPAPAATPRPVPPPSKPAQAPPVRTATGSWRVIVYTYNSRKAPEQRAATINQRHPTLQAEVFSPGGRAPYLISVGGRMTRAEAERLGKRARALGLPRDSFARNFKE